MLFNIYFNYIIIIIINIVVACNKHVTGVVIA